VGGADAPDTINQLLEITNPYRNSVVPVLSITPLDKNRHVLPQVKVSTVYGSDRGSLVAPYGTTDDVLRFSGPGAHGVADVRVTVRSAAVARIPAGPHDVTTQALDGQGRKITRFERFSEVRLTNKDAFPASVRVVYILWDHPAEGDSQQAIEVTAVGGLTKVPAHGNAVVPVTGDAAAAVARDSNGPAVSIKAYNSQ
jgi:hypothetical protein